MSIDEKLYINNIKMELIPRSVGLTLQVNDIAEIKDRNAHYSNNIKLPKTPNNIATLEQLGLIGNITRIPYETVNVKYVLNGIEIVSSGKGILKNTDKFYNLNFYDGNISFSGLIGEAKMNKLDFSSYNHSLTQVVFTDSLTNTSGYIYALGEFFLDNTNQSIISIDLSSPSMFMHTLWDMIFEEKGYTTSGTFLNDDDFKNRLISMNNGYDRFTTENKTSKQVTNVNILIMEDYGSTFTQKIFEIDSYTSMATITHTITSVGSMVIAAGKNVIMVFYVNGSYVSQLDLPDDGSSFNVEENIALAIGDELTIYVGLDSVVITNHEIDFSITTTNIIYENDLSIDIDFALLMGDMSQIDFVKDIMQRYGLIFRKTRHELNFEFIRMKDILIDKSGAEDWSDKYKGKSNERYKPAYAQTNRMKYKYNDNPDANTELTFADGELVLDNINLSLSKTLFTSVFKASTITNTGFWKLNHWVTKEEKIVSNEDGLGIFKKINSGGSFKFKYADTTSGFIRFIGTYPLLNFDSIYYQKEIDNNYLELESMLNDYKFIKINANLSVVDIYDLDFFKLKYFKGQYYYLNKVLDFRSRKITKVELVQIGSVVIDALSMTATSTGESVVSATLIKNVIGQMDGITIGESVVISDLTKTGQTLTAFDTSRNGTTIAFVCGKILDTTRYHDGAGSLPVDTDIIYMDPGGVETYDGGGDYYRSGLTDAIEINNIGVVTNRIDSC